jgi:GDPmannose 4,6-dehydratase
MLQSDKPDDYVISTGKTHSVADFLQEAFSFAGIKNWKSYVEISNTFMRPFEVDALRGLSNKAQEILKWKPTYSFKDLVQDMVESDINGNKVCSDS